MHIYVYIVHIYTFIWSIWGNAYICVCMGPYIWGNTPVRHVYDAMHPRWGAHGCIAPYVLYDYIYMYCTTTYTYTYICSVLHCAALCCTVLPLQHTPEMSTNVCRIHVDMRKWGDTLKWARMYVEFMWIWLHEDIHLNSTNVCRIHVDMSKWAIHTDVHTHLHICINTWARMYGIELLKITDSFVEYSLFYRALLQKRPIISHFFES